MKAGEGVDDRRFDEEGMERRKMTGRFEAMSRIEQHAHPPRTSAGTGPRVLSFSFLPSAPFRPARIGPVAVAPAAQRIRRRQAFHADEGKSNRLAALRRRPFTSQAARLGARRRRTSRLFVDFHAEGER
jgi:hypothetical protein